MNALTAQIIGLVVLFLVTTAVALLPVVVVLRRASRSAHVNSLQSTSIQISLSVANSLASGVFLQICFLALIPEARELFEELWTTLEVNVTYPVGETVIIVGFFIILALEQIVSAHQTKSHKCELKLLGNQNETQQKTLSLESKCLPEVVDANIGKSNGLPSDAYADAERTTGNPGKPAVPSSISTENEHSDSTCETVEVSQLQKKNHIDSVPIHVVTAHHSHGSALVGGHGAISPAVGRRRFLMLLAAISAHSLLEGVAVGLQQSVSEVVKLFTAILVHESLVALAIGIKLADYHGSKKRHQSVQHLPHQIALGAKRIVCDSLRLICCFTVMVPLGIALGIGLGSFEGAVGFAVSGVCQALAAGVFLHVTFMELVPEEIERSKHPVVSIFFMLFGFLSMSGISYYLE